MGDGAVWDVICVWSGLGNGEEQEGGREGGEEGGRCTSSSHTCIICMSAEVRRLEGFWYCYGINLLGVFLMGVVAGRGGDGGEGEGEREESRVWLLELVTTFVKGVVYGS